MNTAFVRFKHCIHAVLTGPRGFLEILLLSTILLSPMEATAADGAQRDVIVTVLSWYGPSGALGGSVGWKRDGFAYSRSRSVGNNYPLSADELVGRTPPAPRSNVFLDLEARLAKQDLIAMKEAGFTVAAYDMLPDPRFNADSPITLSNNPFQHFQSFLKWLEAAEKVGMKVAILADMQNRSADFPNGRILTSREWIACLTGALKAVRGAPALYRIAGKPVVFHFGTDVSMNASPERGAPGPDGGWRKVIAGVRENGADIFFIPDIRPRADWVKWQSFASGLYIFAPGAPKGFLVDQQTEFAQSASLPFVWTVSPGYYNDRLLAFVEPSFERIHETYMAAGREGARAINFLTWNDYEEDTDIAPTKFKGRALLGVVAFYNKWFASGKIAPTEKSRIVVAYPNAVPGSITSKAPKWSRWNERDYEPKLFFWIYSKEGGVLDFGDGVHREFVPGVSFGEVPVSIGQSIAFKVNGRTLLPPFQIRATEKGESHSEGRGLGFRYISVDLSEQSMQ